MSKADFSSDAISVVLIIEMFKLFLASSLKSLDELQLVLLVLRRHSSSVPILAQNYGVAINN